MTAETATFVLPPALTFEACDDLCVALLHAQGADLVLDGSKVTRISGLAAQLLATASLCWAATGRSLTVTDPSDDLRTGLDMLALWPLPQQTGAAGW
ncbi:MAG: STAS domain-containing protein [Loktanella sp.]|nr:STAS domain-containing protein [Loktanella sp.]